MRQSERVSARLPDARTVPSGNAALHPHVCETLDLLAEFVAARLSRGEVAAGPRPGPDGHAGRDACGTGER